MSAKHANFQAHADQIEEAISNITMMSNKATHPDTKLLVFATLVQARATLLVAEELSRIRLEAGR